MKLLRRLPMMWRSTTQARAEEAPWSLLKALLGYSASHARVPVPRRTVRPANAHVHTAYHEVPAARPGGRPRGGSAAVKIQVLFAHNVQSSDGKGSLGVRLVPRTPVRLLHVSRGTAGVTGSATEPLPRSVRCRPGGPALFLHNSREDHHWLHHVAHTQRSTKHKNI